MGMALIATSNDSVRASFGSDLVLAAGWSLASRVLPFDLWDGRVLLLERVEAQTRKVLANLGAFVKTHGFDKEHVAAVRIALVDLRRLQERTEVAYAGFFVPGRLLSAVSLVLTTCRAVRWGRWVSRFACLRA